MELITVSQMIEQNAAKYASATAFQIKKEGTYYRIAYRKAVDMIENLAYRLHVLGINKGDRIALLADNRPEWALAYLAIIFAGAVVVPLDAMIIVDDLQLLLADSGCKGIIIADKFLNMVLHVKQFLPELKFIIDMEVGEDTPPVFSFDKAARVARVSTKIREVTGLDDLAAIVYTSGTTGASKGVMLTHRNLMSNVQAIYSMFDVGPTDNFLSVLPLHHTFECTTGFLAPFYAGAKITYADSLKSYRLLANMRETGVTIMLGVPLLYHLFYDSVLRAVSAKGSIAVAFFGLLKFIACISSQVFKKNIGKVLFGAVHQKLGKKIRFWVSGGAALDPNIIRGFEVFGITILQGYGLTEAAPIITACTLKKNRIGSVGKAISGVKVKILNPDKNGIGEVLASGSNIMRGYYKRPDLTAQVVKDGWLYTGDLGYLDKQGFLFITGRSKNLIVTGAGVNVYPEEIEFMLNRNPFIKESCVLGVKLKKGLRKGGEAVLAVVVPDLEYLKKYLYPKGVAVTGKVIEEIIKDEINKLNEKLAEYKKIAQTRIVGKELPKTSTKKIKRFELRKELAV